MKKKSNFVVPFGEKVSYGLGMLGTNLTYGLVSSYMLIFFTDVFKLLPAAIGVLILVARLWDAVNDPLMGYITDKTRTKWGKFRPYILVSGILLPVFTYLLFASPNLPENAKLAYAYITYIGWGMAYTMSDIPKWSIVSVMTNVRQERVGIISIAKVLGMIGTIGVNVAVIPLVKIFGKGDYAAGYRTTGLVIAIIVLLTSLLIFFKVKERIAPDSNRPTLKESMSAIFKNKPLLLLIAGIFIMFSATMIGQGLQMHYVKYNFGNENLIPIITLITIIPMLLGAIFASRFTKKFGNRKTFMIGIIGMAIRGGLMFLVGYKNVALVVGIMVLFNFAYGLINVVGVAMLTDTIDYSERKTGKRNEGMIFSLQTFVVKFSGAIGGSVAAMALALSGYVENTQQSIATLNGIHAFISIVPAVGAILALIPISFYKIDSVTEKDSNNIAS